MVKVKNKMETSKKVVTFWNVLYALSIITSFVAQIQFDIDVTNIHYYVHIATFAVNMGYLTKAGYENGKKRLDELINKNNQNQGE